MRVFSIVFFFLIAFSSCASDQSNSRATAERRVPNSSGRIDEVVVVMDESVWDDTLGIAVRDLLQEEYPGLPQIEPRFDISYIAPVNLASLIKRASNIIYFGVIGDKQSATGSIIKGHLDNLSESQKPTYMFSTKNLWAKPQQVTYVYGNSTEDLLEVLIQKGDNIEKRLYELEDKKALRNVYASRTNNDLSKELQSKFGIDLKIPNSFRLVKSTDDIFWVRQDIQGEVSNIMVHKESYEDPNSFNTGHPVFARDQMGKLFFTDTPNSHMITDMRVPPIQNSISLNDKSAIESRGLWRMSKDYMGGPYINYSILDEKNKRIITVDGNVYAPQWKKRRGIRKLENMFKQIEII